jgi:hypothetical protein
VASKDDGKTNDAPGAAVSVTSDGAVVELAVTSAPSKGDDKTDGAPAAADVTSDGTEAEPAATEVPSKDGKPGDVSTAADGPKDKTETAEDKEDKAAPQSSTVTQLQNGELPVCGKCSGSLSFPFWYCILCEGQSRLKKDRIVQRLC